MPYGENDGDIYWQGYGIDSITTFIDDVVAINNEKVNLLDLQNTRPSFKESLISTAVIEAAHISLENDSKWQIIEMDD